MTKEFNYTHIEFPATEKVGGAPVNSNVGVVAGLKSGEEREATKETPVVIPESFFEALKRERPDGLNWDRVDAAVSVLKGEKEAVMPKSPEPEPTESQKFWRDMYRTGKLYPYQKDRPGVNLSAVAEAWKNPQSQGVDSKIMAVDLALRGGADKEYNQLGDIEKRATRMGVMALNTIPAIGMDIVTSIPSNLGKRYIEHVLDVKSNIEGATDEQKEKIKKQKASLIGLNKMFEVMNDKNVTATGDWWVRKLTGEKDGWTGESDDKLADLITSAAKDKYEDFINGPTIESIMHIVYEIPIVGAMWEQGWTRLSVFQSDGPFHKGNMKGIFMGVGYLIGALRGKGEGKSPSQSLADSIWGKVFPQWPINKE